MFQDIKKNDAMQDQSLIATMRQVRDPLSKIYLAAEMLESNFVEPEQQEYLNMITRGCDQIIAIVDGVLASYIVDDILPDTNIDGSTTIR